MFESFIVASKASFESDILCVFSFQVFSKGSMFSPLSPLCRDSGYCSVQWMQRFINI